MVRPTSHLWAHFSPVRLTAFEPQADKSQESYEDKLLIKVITFMLFLT